MLYNVNFGLIALAMIAFCSAGIILPTVFAFLSVKNSIHIAIPIVIISLAFLAYILCIIHGIVTTNFDLKFNWFLYFLSIIVLPLILLIAHSKKVTLISESAIFIALLVLGVILSVNAMRPSSFTVLKIENSDISNKREFVFFNKHVKFVEDYMTRIHYETPLMSASKNGDVAEVKRLIESGHKVDEYNETRKTALILASENGHSEIVSLLLERGAKPNDAGLHGFTALMYACGNGYIEIAEMLLENGADVQSKVTFGDYKGSTALLFASENGYIEIVRLLLEHGADVTVKNVWGSTALMLASYYGHTEIIKTLLNHGANVTDKNNSGSTAYDIALYNEHIEISELLKKYRDIE